MVSQGSPMAQAIGGDAAVAATAVVSLVWPIRGGRGALGMGFSDKVGRYPALGIMAVIVAVSGFACPRLRKAAHWPCSWYLPC